MDPVTVIVTFLTQQLGENSHTPRDPIAVYDPEGAHKEITFEETCSVCYACDDDRLVSKQKYGKVEIELPSWLDPVEWLRNLTEWKYTWGVGCLKSWPEAWQRFLAYRCKGNTARKLAVVKLLKVKKFRSEFRASLRQQLDAWLETPEHERAYDSPLSPRQWECLTRWEHRNAKSLDSTLYYSNRYSGWGE